MQNILRNSPSGDHSSTPWKLLLILTGYVLAALVLFQILAQIAVLPFFDFDFQRSLNILSNPYGSAEAKIPLMIIQGITSIGTFILVPVFFITQTLKLQLSDFTPSAVDLRQPLFMTVIIMFCFMVANSIIIEWNQSIELPEFMSFFEDWAKTKETQLEKLTTYLTHFASTWEFFLALLVIAVIPAVGEELLFRGLIQNLFNKAIGNPHTAIWLTGLLFGAFHMQFYGIIPRMLLGVLFGYLYFWSGQLSLAVVAHFVNNSFTLLLIYLGQIEIIDFSPVETKSSPPMYIILIFFAIGSVLLYLYREYFKAKNDA